MAQEDLDVAVARAGEPFYLVMSRVVLVRADREALALGFSEGHHPGGWS